MSIDTLPRGTDALRARQAEMARHANGRLARSPEKNRATVVALVTRLLAARSRLAAIDNRADPDPDPLRLAEGRLVEHRDGLTFGYELAWHATDALVVSMLAIEARIGALDGGMVEAGVLGPIAAEIDLMGYQARHEERAHTAIETMILRTLAAEARLADLAAKGAEAE